MIEIRHLQTGEVLHTVDADTLQSADLTDAGLRGADLSYADLTNATLIRAYIPRADLRDTDLTRANLFRANLTHTDLRAAKLSGADMSGANLSGANLSGAVLHDTDLRDTDMSGANLTHANLGRANLTRANLIRADLRGTDLRDTDMSGAKLNDADLSNVNLNGADLTRADFSKANLTHAHVASTLFVDCLTLHQAEGLETVSHHGASILDARTLRACVNHLPAVFLRGVGYTNEEIENLRAMYATGIRLFSCFISYRHTDAEFALRLHNDLEAVNVPCWIDAYDMQGGKFYAPQLHAAVKAHDKLLLVCSQEAVTRQNVVEEIVAAIDAEREQKVQKLFPVKLDEFILSDEMLKIADRKMLDGEWRLDWVRHVRAFHIPDFSKSLVSGKKV